MRDPFAPCSAAMVGRLAPCQPLWPVELLVKTPSGRTFLEEISSLLLPGGTKPPSNHCASLRQTLEDTMITKLAIALVSTALLAGPAFAQSTMSKSDGAAASS